jgi:hypothetical protein
MAESIFAKLQVDAEQKKKLDKIEKESLELEEISQKELGNYEKSLTKMLDGDEKVSVEELSRLDEGIKRGRKFKGEISDLAESLTGELQELGQFFGDMAHYKGFWEKTCAGLGLRKTADRSRLKRVRSADVKQNLQTILDYGHHMVGKLYNAILQNIECHAKIDDTIQLTSKKLEDHQVDYEEWREKKEKLQREHRSLDDRIDEETDQKVVASLERKKSTLQKKLHEAEVNENHYFTIVDKAKKALGVQRTHLKAYKDMIDSLTQLKTGLEEDLDSITQLYLAVPTAIQTALSVKAASTYDKGMKYATDVATDTVLKSAAGVLDEAASRSERPLIEQEKLEAYRKAQREMRAEFDGRITALKKKYAGGKA